MSIIICCFADKNHFMHNFLELCPSGRLRHVKYRISWGKGRFLKQMCVMLNEILLKCKLHTGTLVVSSFYDEVYMHPFLAT